VSRNTLITIIAIAAVVVLAIIVFAALRARRRPRLRSRFGPEYDRAVEGAGSRREAERELSTRAERREQLDIRPLDTAAAQRYREQWALVQQRFVDAPAESVGQAHSLLTMAMGERGYPIDDTDERASMLSVDHADVMDNYRAGMRTEQAWRKSGTADTEELRQAMQHYREVFGRVVGETVDGDDAYPDDEQTTTSSKAGSTSGRATRSTTGRTTKAAAGTSTRRKR
jgi:hypothetical protein